VALRRRVQTTASADPGAAVSVSGISVGVGDATANSSFGNAALAFNGGEADASGKGIGNLAIASGANSKALVGDGNFNAVVATNGGESHVANGNGNVVLSTGAKSHSQVTGQGSANLVATLCGGSKVAAQSAQIKTSAPCLGA
jgi:hypothetical protein